MTLLTARSGELPQQTVGGCALVDHYDGKAIGASRFDATIAPDPSSDLYLHSDGSACPNGGGESPGVTSRFLNATAPGATSAKCKDSSTVNFAGSNPFSVIGTWALPQQP